MNNDVSLMIEVMHSVYCNEVGGKSFPAVRENCVAILDLYERMCTTLNKLDIGDEQLRMTVSYCQAKDNLDKWFIWAAIDNNLATMSLNGHVRRKKDESRQAT